MIQLLGLMGNEFFGSRMVSALNKKIDVTFLYPSLHNMNFKNKIKDIDIIHFIGSPTVSTHGVLTFLRLKSWKKKIIIHWIGADSWLATNKIIPQFYTNLLKNKIDLHLAIEKELARKIEKIGIKAIIQPLPVATHYELQPLPDEKQVLVYAPDKNEYYWNRFNGNIIKKIVKEFPNVNFIIARNSGKYFDEANVSCFEWVDNMEELYKKVIAIVRISTHDGLPGTIIEALSMGRQLVYSQEFPFCKKATTFEELKSVLTEIIDNPTLNEEGSKFVNENYNIEKITNELVEIYKKL